MIPAQVQDQIADLHQLCGVESDRRLVQDQHRESHTLLVAFGQVADQTLLHVCNFQPFHNTLDFALPLGGRDAFQSSGEVQILPDLHIRIYRRDLRQKADALFCLDGLLCNVIALDLYRSAGGRDDTSHNI